ncbi:MAG: type I methionyl aminopeptidase [Bacteroidales bacterium]|nr:type I methionyl aminopeptidase [Bacteroidales bacterium]
MLRQLLKQQRLVKTETEIELIRQSSLLVGKTLAEVARYIHPGVTTKYLDEKAEAFIKAHGAVPSFKGYNGFPASLCTSINEVVVHGIPCETQLREGDIISIDCGVLMNGYHGDSAYTFSVGKISEEKALLLERTKASLYKGIARALRGNRTGDIAHAIQSYTESFGYGVVRDLVGHGVGRELHEKPEVPNFGKRGSGHKLEVGMTIAIEPMINQGKRQVVMEKNGWNVRTVDRKPSAHFEHTVVVGTHRAEILSTFEFIEQILNEI